MAADGTVVLIFPELIDAAVETVFKPLTHVTKNVPVGAVFVENKNDEPGLAGVLDSAVRPGKALNGSAVFVDGQEVMKEAASV